MKTAEPGIDPALRAALSVFRPTPAETGLLRCCLSRDSQVARDWASFLEAAPRPADLFRADTGRRKRLAPLLLAGLRRGDVPLPGPLATVLRTAAFRESLRADVYHRICGELIDALEDASVPFLLIGGAAMGLSVYDHASLRHSHEVDLLVAPGHEGRARAALGARGLGMRPSDRPRYWTTLRHATGMPVRIKTNLYPLPFYQSDWADVLSGSRRVALGDRSVLVPGQAHALVRTAVEASYRPRQASLHWAADLVMLSRELTEEGWTGVISLARGSGATLPVLLLLEFVEEALDAPVPSRVLRALGQPVPPLARDAALYAARRGPGGGVSDLLSRVEGPWDRLRLASWLAFPSAPFVQALEGEGGVRFTAAWYLRRLLSRVTGAENRPDPDPATLGAVQQP